jgi:glucokinase
MILVADIGGTKSLFALCRIVNSKPEIIAEKKYPSKNLHTLEEAIAIFLTEVTADPTELESACFALAGPIEDGYCKLINLGLIVRLENVRNALSFIPRLFLQRSGSCRLRNSLLGPEDLQELNPGNHSDRPRPRTEVLNRAVIAPGTGLGEALIMGEKVYPSEGAHCEFGPRTEEEVGLWRFLHHKFGHVSYERVLSGPGLLNIYRFLWEDLEQEQSSFCEPDDLTSEEISNKALNGLCPLCQHALHLFVNILGAEAGNLALKSLARGGIYIGGGIPPKILPKLMDGTFLSAFRDKGRFSYLLEQIPVYVILDQRTALYGAALLASRLRPKKH